MEVLVDLGIGLMIIGVASLVLGVGLKLLRENSKNPCDECEEEEKESCCSGCKPKEEDKK